MWKEEVRNLGSFIRHCGNYKKGSNMNSKGVLYSDLFPTEEFGKYCDDIVNTAAWGST